MCERVCVYACVCVCVYMCMRVCACMCVCACAYACMCNGRISVKQQENDKHDQGVHNNNRGLGSNILQHTDKPTDTHFAGLLALPQLLSLAIQTASDKSWAGPGN